MNLAMKTNEDKRKLELDCEALIDHQNKDGPPFMQEIEKNQSKV